MSRLEDTTVNSETSFITKIKQEKDKEAGNVGQMSKEDKERMKLRAMAIKGIHNARSQVPQPSDQVNLDDE